MSWNLDFDIEEVTKELNEIEENNGSNSRDYEEIPYGKYEVKCLGIEPYTSKAGKAMIKFEYQILEGQYKNSHMWQYMSIQNDNPKTVAFLIHLANEFMKSMLPEESDKATVQFDNANQYTMVIGAVSDIVTNQYEYVLNYFEDKKGYAKYKIEDIFEVE